MTIVVVAVLVLQAVIVVVRATIHRVESSMATAAAHTTAELFNLMLLPLPVEAATSKSHLVSIVYFSAARSHESLLSFDSSFRVLKNMSETLISSIWKLALIHVFKYAIS